MKSIFLLVGAALIFWSWLMLRREGHKAAPAISDRGQKDLEAAIEELTSLAEEVTSDLKRKSAELQTLINEADRRIFRLETQAEAHPRVAEPSEVPGPAGPVKARLAVASPTDPVIRNERNEIWELAQRGMDVTEIAKVSKKTKGEVELILRLRKLG